MSWPPTKHVPASNTFLCCWLFKSPQTWASSARLLHQVEMTPRMDPVVPTSKVLRSKDSQLSTADANTCTLDDLFAKSPAKLFVAGKTTGSSPNWWWTTAPGSAVRVRTIFDVVREGNSKSNNPVGSPESTHFAQMFAKSYFEVCPMVGLPLILQQTCLAYRAPFLQCLRAFASKETKRQSEGFSRADKLKVGRTFVLC